MVKLQGGSATVSGCSINESAVHGVWGVSGSVTLQGTTVVGIPATPVVFAASSGLTVTGCHLTGESACGLYAQGSATLTSNTIALKAHFSISATTATVRLTSNASVSLQGSGNTFTGGSAIRLPSCEQEVDWLFLDADTQVLSCRPGTVGEVVNDRRDVPTSHPDIGNRISLDHGVLDDDSAYFTTYCHLLRGSISWNRNQSISTQGCPLGNRGLVEGPSWHHTRPDQ